MSLLLAVAPIAVIGLDPGPHTLDPQPVRIEAAFAAFVLAFGGVLTILELARSFTGAATALARPAQR